MKTTKTIEIQFRKLKGDVIAVFPYEIWNSNDVVSYSHRGQHSAAAWYINDFTTAAKPAEYKELLQELKSIYNDYNIKVITKRSHQKFLSAYKKWIKEIK